MNQSDIAAMKKRLADREGKAEPFWLAVIGAIFWALFCLIVIFIPIFRG
jgi:hypothetical protein